MRVKGEYIHHETLHGAMGIKISAPELDNALAGGELFKADNEDDIQEHIEEIEDTMVAFVEKYLKKNEMGVCVQASTLGSLEALLEFLKKMKIPVTEINIGPVNKKDVTKAMKWLSVDEDDVRKEFATILAFDVKIS